MLHLLRRFHSFKQLIKRTKNYFVYCVLKKIYSKENILLLLSNLKFTNVTLKCRRKIILQRQRPIKTVVCISKIRLGGGLDVEGRKKKQHRPWNCRNSRTSDALDKCREPNPNFNFQCLTCPSLFWIPTKPILIISGERLNNNRSQQGS